MTTNNDKCNLVKSDNKNMQIKGLQIELVGVLHSIFGI